jgi:hypothetical protein
MPIMAHCSIFTVHGTATDMAGAGELKKKIAALLIFAFFLFDHAQGMTYEEVVENHFDLSDINNDGQIDSREWIKYLADRDHHPKRDKATRHLR